MSRKNDQSQSDRNVSHMGSSVSPSKKPPLQLVYEFYCKQTYASGKHVTFEQLQQESTTLDLQKFFHFCRDFGLGSREETMEIYKKVAPTNKHINYSQFEQCLLAIAAKKELAFDELLVVLELTSWQEAKLKLKMFRKPFFMKEEQERYKKDDIKYQFKLYHPDVKDQERLRQILEARRQEREAYRSQERERKDFIKLRQELKHLQPNELIEKYPEKRQLIERLRKVIPRRHREYFKMKQVQNYSKEDERVAQEHVSEFETPQRLNWNVLEGLQVNQSFIHNLVGEQLDDDVFLKEYQLPKKESDIQAERYGVLQSKKRSFSENTTTQKHALLRVIKQKDTTSRENPPTEKAPAQVNRAQQSPNKLNLSVLKRAKEIQNLQLIREKNYLDQILQQQKLKSKKL